MELLDAESYQIKEVYAHFGLAMFMAQGLEQTLAIALATVYGPGTQRITRTQYDDLLKLNFRKTLGMLINQIRKTVELTEELEQMLSEALEKRNWLAHDYFRERAVVFNDENGRDSMIKELKETADFIEDVDYRFMAILEQWGEKHGVTEQIIERIMRGLVSGEQAV